MAVTLSIDQGIGAVAYPSGARSVSPAVTTEYTLTATSTAGQVKTRRATVTVQAAIDTIDESGSRVDIIDESGSRSDLIDESGSRA